MSNTVLLAPVLTEKSLNQKDLYVFKVSHMANKHQIKEVIETTYKVKVKEVRTLVKKGKVKTVGKKRLKKALPLVKQAYVTLSQGKIDDFPKNN